jgi:hypothetical protein
MPWQKTFTLSSRSKGVHLVTDEVMQHIGAGVKECKVGLLQLLCVRAAPRASKCARQRLIGRPTQHPTHVRRTVAE